MILFLHGPDTYRSKQKLQEIVATYKDIHKSGLSFKLFYAEENTFDDFKNAVEVIPMFDEKKLIVLKGFCRLHEFNDAFMAWSGKEGLKNSPDAVSVFYEEESDKSSNVFSWLTTNSQSQEFALLGGAKLNTWIKKFVERNNISVEQAALWRLAAYSGGDLWKFVNEMDKLTAYKRGGSISAQDVGLFSSIVLPKNIFALVDAIVSGNKAAAIRQFLDFKTQGDEMRVFYLLCGRFRFLALDRRFNRGKIKKFYSKLAEFDVSIKTGQLEPYEALEQLIFEA